MFCSSCGKEFARGVQQCPECGQPLVEASATSPPDHSKAPVIVFRTAESALVPVIKSLLDGSGIPYNIKGEEVLGLFPGIGVGLAIDPKARAAEVEVPADRATEARNLLEALSEEEVSDDG